MAQDLVKAKHVRSAIREFDRLGRTHFLKHYHFGRSRRYFLEQRGHYYDSKAIYGVAYGFAVPKQGPLLPSVFAGGELTVKRKLEAIRYNVVDVLKHPRKTQHFLFKLLAADFPAGTPRPSSKTDWEGTPFDVQPVQRMHFNRKTNSPPVQPGDEVAIWHSGDGDEGAMVGLAKVHDVFDYGYRCILTDIRLIRPVRLSDLDATANDHVSALADNIRAVRTSKVRHLSDATWREIVAIAEQRMPAGSGPFVTPIGQIANELNVRARSYAMGRLQAIRAQLNSKRKQTDDIFTTQSIHASKQYALHWGGRSELQFNIGFVNIQEQKLFRYGVAFSLEPSRAFSNPMVLTEKIRHFNDYLAACPEAFDGLDMWIWRGGVRGDAQQPRALTPDDVALKNFIFFGRLCPATAINYDEILRTFDELLPLYEYVESRAQTPLAVKPRRPFSFASARRPRARTSNISKAAQELVADLRHGEIQRQLESQLIKRHGKNNVCIEVESGCGTLIDAVVRKGRSYWFYEIKTAPTARACLRDAIGQLLEYSLWPGAECAARLIVVGEGPIEKEGKAYLKALRQELKRPVEYVQVTI